MWVDDSKSASMQEVSRKVKLARAAEVNRNTSAEAVAAASSVKRINDKYS